jgi:hypothetical protein
MTTFKYAATFSGVSQLSNPGGDNPSVELKFSTVSEVFGTLPPGLSEVTPLMVANALNDLLTANGWPATVFTGPPVDEPLN